MRGGAARARKRTQLTFISCLSLAGACKQASKLFGSTFHPYISEALDCSVSLESAETAPTSRILFWSGESPIAAVA